MNSNGSLLFLMREQMSFLVYTIAMNTAMFVGCIHQQHFTAMGTCSNALECHVQTTWYLSAINHYTDSTVRAHDWVHSKHAHKTFQSEVILLTRPDKADKNTSDCDQTKPVTVLIMNSLWWTAHWLMKQLIMVITSKVIHWWCYHLQLL